MAHAQKPDFVFRRNGRVHLNRRGRQFSRLLAAEVWASAVVMLDTPCSEVVWRVLATHSIRQFHLHFPALTSPCAVRFQLGSSHSTRLNLGSPLTIAVLTSHTASEICIKRIMCIRSKARFCSAKLPGHYKRHMGKKSVGRSLKTGLVCRMNWARIINIHWGRLSESKHFLVFGDAGGLHHNGI